MSQFMVKSHGGGKAAMTSRMGAVNTGAIVHDTMVNSPRPVHMKHLDMLVSQTTGVAEGSPILEGVLTQTQQGTMYGGAATSGIVASHGEFKTAKAMPATGFGQVPYADAKYGGRAHAQGSEVVIGTGKSMAKATKVKKGKKDMS